MEQVIYADVLFAVNFSMDFLSLCAAGSLTRSRLRPIALAAAAAIGGVYGTAAVFLHIGGAFGWAVNAAVAALMCFCAFDRAGALALLKRTLVFYGVGFVLGGVMTALYSRVGNAGGSRAVINGALVTVTRRISLPLLCLFALCGGVAALVAGRIVRKRREVDTAEIEISVGEYKMSVNALCDSGNLCREPISGLPVIFVSVSRLRRFLPKQAVDAMISPHPDAAARLPREFARVSRLVPVRTLNGSSIRVALLCDVKINGGVERACLVASDNSFGDEDVMIPTTLAAR